MPLHQIVPSSSTTLIHTYLLLCLFVSNIINILLFFQDCKWGEWEEWDDCPKSCGNGGLQLQERFREKIQEKISTDDEFGKACTGRNKQRRTCKPEFPCTPATKEIPSISFFEGTGPKTPYPLEVDYPDYGDYDYENMEYIDPEGEFEKSILFK